MTLVALDRLRFEAARLNMEITLEFPVIYQEGTTTHANTSIHSWEYCRSSRKSKKFMKLWWEFIGEEVKTEIPQVWRKVNGGWQIVY